MFYNFIPTDPSNPNDIAVLILYGLTILTIVLWELFVDNEDEDEGPGDNEDEDEGPGDNEDEDEGPGDNEDEDEGPFSLW